MSKSFIISMAALLAVTVAYEAHGAELNLVRGAHLTASSFQTREILFEKGDDLPHNAADTDPNTAWSPADGAPGPQWLRFDFTRPWPMRYRWTKLITRWETPPATFRWEASRDGKTWVTVVTVSSPQVEDTQAVAVSAPYLRIVIADDTSARLTEAEAYSSSGGSGRLEIPSAEVAGNIARVTWDTSTQDNVFLYRVSRVSALPLQRGNTATIVSLITESPVDEVSDRVEFPDIGLAFEYSWIVEAFAPNGDTIGQSKSTQRLNIPKRSEKPFEMRGIIEGFYGPAFSWEDREMLVRFTGLQGGNFYLYGPKLDPYHREDWREPYPDSFMTAFEQLIMVGENHSVRVAWSLSPGLDYDGSIADKEAALAKYQAMFDQGVRWFGLFFDDIEADASATEAAKQVELANYLYTELAKQDPLIGFLFVPTVYSGVYSEMTTNQQDYLVGLQALHLNFLVMWTGPGIFSPTIEQADTNPIFDATMHTLIIWDNFPVSDTFLGRRIHLGHLAGRSPKLADRAGSVLSVGGLLSNPLWQAPLNRLPLTSVFAYLRSPGTYDGPAAIREAVSREAPEAVAGIFSAWLENFSTNDLIGVDSNGAYRAVSDAVVALESGTLPNEAFFRHAAHSYVMEAKLKHLHQPDLAGALVPFAQTTAALGEAELLLMQSLNGTGEAERAIGETTERLQQAEKLGWIANRGADIDLLKRFLATPPAVSNRGPKVRGSLPQRLTIGQTYTARFDFADAETVSIIGLSGASLRADGSFKWRPTRTGTERWVVLASKGAKTSVLYGEFDVIAQQTSEETGCASSGEGSWIVLAVFMALAATRRFTRLYRIR